ncbi:MAG: ATP-binding protein [Thermomicrobiales bacterium]
MADQIAGVGVGLYITDQIVRQHGGAITVRSDVGRGSEFSVHVPRRRG